jgi:flavin-binding protein dodecin
MNALILYNSRKGHTRAAANAIARAAQDEGCNIKMMSVIEVRKTDVDQADVVFIGTWTQGLILFSVRPAGAELWVPTLPPLDGKPTGVFTTYLFNPLGSLKALGKLVTQRGANVLAERAFHRSQPGSGAAQFVESVLHAPATIN